MHLDPYKFLGVTPNSSLSELRRAYYSLALLVHPDKGGSDSDMIVLERSYAYIKEQLESVAERGTKTSEDLEREFTEFLEMQDLLRPPAISDVFAESIGFTKDVFAIQQTQTQTQHTKLKSHTIPDDIIYNMVLNYLHSEWLKNKFIDVLSVATAEIERLNTTNEELFPASIPHGYQDDMVQDDTQPIAAFGKHTVVTYTEPKSFFEIDSVSCSDLPPKLADYSTSTRTLHLTDYKQAFKERDTESFDALFDPNTKDSFEILLEARRLERL